MLSFITRIAKSFKNPQAIKTLYFTLVRPTLEYYSTIWNPHTQNFVYLLEKAQNKFFRFLMYKMNIPIHYTDHEYSTVQSIANILPLESRRTRQDLLILYKIINGYIHSACLLEKNKL